MRVEIVRNASPDYSIVDSYKREYNEADTPGLAEILENLVNTQEENDKNGENKTALSGSIKTSDDEEGTVGQDQFNGRSY